VLCPIAVRPWLEVRYVSEPRVLLLFGERERGWPTLMILALAYAVLEEAFTTQTLFNPNYLHLNLHLLDHAYVPVLGIGLWWTFYVLTLHTVWSIGVSIALTEALFPNRAADQWLGIISFPAMVLTFLFGIAATTVVTLRLEQQKGGIFVASPGQFLGAGLVFTALVVIAFAIPNRSRTRGNGLAVSPWIAGAASFLSTSIFMLIPPHWGWCGTAVFLVLCLAMVMFVLHQSSRQSWNGRHRMALAAGAMLTYAWHAFALPSAVSDAAPGIDIVSDVVFGVGALVLIIVAARRTQVYYAKPAKTSIE
jgi:hypothetical protein